MQPAKRTLRLAILAGSSLLTLSNIGFFLIITGLFFSRIALSVGMALLFVNAVIYYFQNGKLNSFQSDNTLLIYTALFFLFLLTGFYSEDKLFFWERIRIYLPLVVIPFAFSLPFFGQPEDARKWFLLYFLLVSATAIHSVFDCIWTNNLHDKFARMSTPLNHVRYSLMVSFSVFVGLYLYATLKTEERRWRIPALMLVVFLFLYLHLLSVRSGLLGFYLAVLFIGLRNLVLRKKKNLVVVGLGLLACCFASFALFPSLYQKLDTTRQTVSSLVHGKEVEDLSDFGRVKSIEAGLHVGLANFWMGVGVGDVKKEVAYYYRENCPKLVSKNILPHNQFIFAFSAAGLFGILLFSFAVIYPLFYYQIWKDDLAIGFNTILLTSFQFDHTLETQIGMGFYIFFQHLLIQSIKAKPLNAEHRGFSPS